MNHAAVELHQVSKVFSSGRGEEEVLAVNQVNLVIQSGEFFTLLGPSGCGKTTTLRLIAGFETPTSGEVYIQGKPMGRTPPNQRPVNTVFQNYALFPHLTVLQNVAFGLAVKKTPKTEQEQRARQALELVRLAGMGNRKPSQLSGGQQQRVALARALVNQPAVLLLDEPLGALDLKLRKAMQIELKQIQKQVGITFIYVTHDQEEALTMSDRIAVMNQGLVLQVGDPVSLYERPATRFVADFIGESNFLEGEVAELSPGVAVLRLADRLVKVSLDQPALTEGKKLTFTIRPEKIHLLPPQPENPQALPAVIQEVVYIGTDTRYLTRLPDQQVVTVRVQNACADDLQRYPPGSAVQLTWNLSDARVIAE